MIIAVCLAVVVVLIVRAVAVVRVGPPLRRPPRRVCVILGSGGHTSEMFQMLSCVDQQCWRNNRPFYVVADTDKDSEAVAHAFEEKYNRFGRCCRIPRAREVGQSYFTSIGTTCRSICHAMMLVYSERPDVIFCNGPGVLRARCSLLDLPCFPRRSHSSSDRLLRYNCEIHYFG